MKFLWFLILIFLFTGCRSQQAPSSIAEGNGQAIPAQGIAGGGMSTEPANLLKGKVLERIDVENYSYLRLSTSSGEIWAAVLPTDVGAGREVGIVNPMPMDGFESKTLNRTFDRIVFGTIYQPDVEGTTQTLMAAHSSVSEAANFEPVNVEKAAGPEGRTIGEIFAQRLELKDRKVTVRGIVTKVNANILDRTWIHIQDGTGDTQAKNNDLTITSQSDVSVGDKILVEGIVRTDMNYGMGYAFPVIIEDATVTKQ